MKIILNGEEWDMKRLEALSYDDILWFLNRDRNKVYTITYSNGKRVKGTLTKGEKVKLRKGLIINVMLTDNS